MTYIEKFKELMEDAGYEVIELKSCSEQMLRRTLIKHGNKIQSVLIVKRR
jgi:hypothetical protein